MKHIFIRSFFSALATLSMVPVAFGATITLDVDESGWIQADGAVALTESSENYVVGVCGSTESCQTGNGMPIRNWFVFDLSGVTDPITSATLQLYNPSLAAGDSHNGFNSPDSSENYELHSYESSIFDLKDEQGLGSYADLGDGISFGMATISSVDNGTVIEIVLNADAINAINAASGEIAFGGSLSTLSGQTFLDEGIFIGTNNSGLRRELVLTSTIPIPAAVWLFGSGLGLLGWMRRKQS